MPSPPAHHTYTPSIQPFLSLCRPPQPDPLRNLVSFLFSHTSPFYPGVTATCAPVPWEPVSPSHCCTDTTGGADQTAAPIPRLHLLASPPEVSFSSQPTSAWPVPVVPLKCVLHKCFLKEQNPLSLFTVLQALEKNATNSLLSWPHQETRSPTVEGKSTRNQAARFIQPQVLWPLFLLPSSQPREDRPPLTRSTRFMASVPLSPPLLSWFLVGGMKSNVMISVWKNTESFTNSWLNWTRTFPYGEAQQWGR